MTCRWCDSPSPAAYCSDSCRAEAKRAYNRDYMARRRDEGRQEARNPESAARRQREYYARHIERLRDENARRMRDTRQTKMRVRTAD